MIVTKDNKYVNIKLDYMEENQDLNIDSIIHSDELFWNDLYFFIDSCGDSFLIDTSQNVVFAYPSINNNVFFNWVQELINHKQIELRRIDNDIEINVLNDFHSNCVTLGV